MKKAYTIVRIINTETINIASLSDPKEVLDMLVPEGYHVYGRIDSNLLKVGDTIFVSNFEPATFKAIDFESSYLNRFT